MDGAVETVDVRLASPSPPAPSLSPSPSAVSAAQRARAERNRQRARALRDARLAARPSAAAPAPAPPLDTGGGFLLEPEEGERAAPAPPPPAPLHDPSERPPCLECGRPIAHSYLLDTFEYTACDECREAAAAAAGEGAEGPYALLTRTEAKSEYLLRDADLDVRGGPLRCVVRRNPHSSRGDMRLYLRAQVERRALLVWGSERALEEELERREAKRVQAKARRGARALRALRMEVRSSLFAGAKAAARGGHSHTFGAETYDAEADVYTRACACGHVETYEKM